MLYIKVLDRFNKPLKGKTVRIESTGFAGNSTKTLMKMVMWSSICDLVISEFVSRIRILGLCTSLMRQPCSMCHDVSMIVLHASPLRR